jgi:hypothetical protein
MFQDIRATVKATLFSTRGWWQLFPSLLVVFTPKTSLEVEYHLGQVQGCKIFIAEAENMWHR